MNLILTFSADETGVSAVEYGFLLTFIALAIVGTVTTLGGKVTGLFFIPWP